MPVYQDKKRGTWYVNTSYTNFFEERKEKKKRGFATKKEAQAWERDFLESKCRGIDMTFGTFVQRYMADVSPKLKPTTNKTKESIIKLKILPLLGKKPVSGITPADLITFLNEVRNSEKQYGGKISNGYVKNVWGVLKAIFAHAYAYYKLPDNPCQRVSTKELGLSNKASTGSRKQFWTRTEFEIFIKALESSKAKPCYHCAFDILYWCGLRVGELLALSESSFDLPSAKLSVTKNFQHVKGQDFIQTPKTKKSVRTVDMPSFLVAEVKAYLSALKPQTPETRIFPFRNNTLRYFLKRTAKKAGIEPIKIHGLRHSHVSLLVNMGIGREQIAERLGHETIAVTALYSHLFPSSKQEMIAKLEQAGNSA